MPADSQTDRVSTTIRVTTSTHDRFVRLAQATGRPKKKLLVEAADALERTLCFGQLHDRYVGDALRAPSATM